MKTQLTKHMLAFLAVTILAFTSLIAQQPELYGTAGSGGEFKAGTIFKTDENSDNLKVIYNFPVKDEGIHPVGSLCAFNGKYYGMTEFGGKNNHGVIYEWDPTENNYEVIYIFNHDNGEYPNGSLLHSINNKLYGIAGGGMRDEGVLFELDPSTNTFTKKFDLTKLTGSNPVGSLMQAHNGKLYGLTSRGGKTDKGVLFEWDTATNTYTDKFDFNGTGTGGNPVGALIQAANGKLYGMNSQEGAYGYGVLFEWDPDLNVYTKKFDFKCENGCHPNGSLIKADNGMLYGVTENGGVFGAGVLFEWDPVMDNFVKKFDFNGVENGSSPSGPLILANNGKLYGVTTSGGSQDRGVLFTWDPANNTYTKELDFDGTEKGAKPVSLTLGENNCLFGITSEGGLGQSGLIFEWNIDSETYTKKIDFNESENGSFPNGTLVQTNNENLYGTTERGGEFGGGVIFEWNNSTQTYIKKADFNGTVNGSFPNGSLLLEDNGKLIGMTWGGGENNQGVIYEWDPFTNVLSKKFDFRIGENGSFPMRSLVQAGNGKFYGVAYAGGVNEKGVLFEWNPVTNIFLKKLDFDGSGNGNGPCGSLILADNGKLYGITASGGEYDMGVIFEWNPLTDTYTKKLDLHSKQNYNPCTSMMLADNGKFYGIICGQNNGSGGIIFEWDSTSNKIIEKVENYELGMFGGFPVPGLGYLMQARNGKIYGMNFTRGAYHSGVLFEWDLVTNAFVIKKSFNMMDGTNPRGNLIEMRHLPPDILKTDLIAYYPFNGNTYDKSGNGHHGTNNGAIPATDRFGNFYGAYNFSGEHNTLSFSGFQLPDPSFTISGWVKITNETTDTVFHNISKGIAKLLLRTVDHRYRVEISIGENQFILSDENGVFEIDTQHPRFDFLIVSYNGSEINLKINNRDIAHRNTEGKILKSMFPFTLKNDIVYSCDGIVDDIRIFGRELNDAEMEALYSDRISTKPVLTIHPVEIKGSDFADISLKLNFDGGSGITETYVYWSTSPNPDTTNRKMVVYSSYDQAIIHLIGLQPNTTYYVKAYAINNTGVGYSNEIAFTTLPDIKFGSVRDVEGNLYRTVQIGVRNWMAENLKTSKFNDGTPVPNVTDNLEWANLDHAAYCWYDNMEENYKGTYGALYNYYSVTDSHKICPAGWHIPTPEEWASLPCCEICSSGDGSIYCEFREAGPVHWKFNHDGTNSTGFTVLPGGVRQGWLYFSFQEPLGEFKSIQFVALYWKSNGNYKLYPSSNYIANIEWFFTPSHFDGYSIRCVEDDDITAISTPDQSIVRDSSFEIPVYAVYLPAGDVVSYQFNLNYDPEKIQYQSYSTDGTLSSKGNVQVNAFENRLFVSWSGRTPLADSGALLNLRFRAVEMGTTKLLISNFLCNDDTARNIENGTITINDQGQPTGISEPSRKSIEMYPNPANTLLYFRNLTGNAKISVYDLQGRELISRVITDNRVDIGGLEYGIYTVRIEDAETTIIRKLIKQ